MGLFDNLPGAEIQVQDGGLRITRPLSGPKVTFLGTTDRTDVDLFDPYLLTRRDEARFFDLVDGKPSEISKAIAEAFTAGADNVEAMVIARSATGLSEAERYSALDTAYDVLLNAGTDVTVPVGGYIDATGLAADQNFAYQLANFAYKASTNLFTVVGVAPVTPPTALAATTGGLSLIQLEAHVAALEAYDTSALQGTDFSIYDGTTDVDLDGIPENYGFVATTDEKPATSPLDADVIKDERGNFVDIGAYISVFAGWHRYFNEPAQDLFPELGYYNANGAAAYAGVISSLNSWSSPSNKPMSGATPVRNLSLSQANRLAGKRFVSGITKTNGFVVANAMTGAHNISKFYRSDFVRLTTVRIVHDVIDIIRLVSDPYLGEPINGANLNALDVALDRALFRLRRLGALNDFKFSIHTTPTSRVLGEVFVDITLVPAFELQKVRAKIALTPEFQGQA